MSVLVEQPVAEVVKTEEQLPEIDENQQNPQQFFKNFLNQTEKITESIYEKSPIKSELIVKNAQKLEETLNNVAKVMDTNLNKTLEVYNKQRLSITEELQSKKGKLQQELYTRSTKIHNNMIAQIASQLQQIKGYVSPTNSTENSETSENDEVVDISKRYVELWNLLTSIFENVQVMQMSLVKNNLPLEKLQELRICQQIVFDMFNERVQTPYLVPAFEKSVALKEQGKAMYQAQYAALQVQYAAYQQKWAAFVKSVSAMNMEDAKVKVTVMVQKGKDFVAAQKVEDFKQYLPLLKEKAEVLKGSAVTFYKNYFTVEFAQQFYEENKVKIAEALKMVKEQMEQGKVNSLKALEQAKVQLEQGKVKSMEMVMQGKQKSVEVYNQTIKMSQEYVQASKNAYTDALAEFKKRKAEQCNKQKSE